MNAELIWDRKHSEAEYKLSFSFHLQLTPGSVLLSGTVTTNDSQMTLSEIAVDGTDIMFRVAGGTPGKIATLTFIGESSDNETLAAKTFMAVD